MALRPRNSTLVLGALGFMGILLMTAFVAPRSSVPRPDVTVSVADPLSVAVAAEVELLDEPRVPAQRAVVPLGPVANPVFTVRATAYNSLESQTDATPHITATGTRTRWGVLAASRDLLGADLPYGSLVRLTDLGNFHNGRGRGAYQALLNDVLFVIEDTMHARKTNQVDLWFSEHREAVNWGVRSLRVELVRYGHDGPVLDPAVADEPVFDARAAWLASR